MMYAMRRFFSMSHVARHSVVRLKRARWWLLPVTAIAVQGCSSARGFMPVPNLYETEGSYQRAAQNDRTNSQLEVLYVTDRATITDTSQEPTTTEDGKLTSYGNGRSASSAFGVAQIGLKPALHWPALANASDGSSSTPLKFGGVQAVEHGRNPEAPYVFSVDNDGRSKVTEQTLDSLLEAKLKFRQLVVERLEQNDTNDVVLFVHGFNNSFEYAAQTLSGFWHFLQRRQVPILYSWPAGVGGLRGYFIDRVSGQYTIFHLKETLRVLFETPEIDKIHIIAHSRGTDVITTALRELLIENRGGNRNSREDFRIANLILAAPDLDYGVVQQRLMAERFGTAFEQVTVYTTSTDKALGLSQFLMRGMRFGLLGSGIIDKRDRSILENVGNVNFVLTSGVKSLTGHDYFFRDPGVSSDLITVINNTAQPGTALRPLIHQGGNFWKLNSGYPYR